MKSKVFFSFDKNKRVGEGNSDGLQRETSGDKRDVLGSAGWIDRTAQAGGRRTGGQKAQSGRRVYLRGDADGK